MDCLNRHGIKTIQSCCGHGGEGDIIISEECIVPNKVCGGEVKGWRLLLAPRPVTIPYVEGKGVWVDESPRGGKGFDSCPLKSFHDPVDGCPLGTLETGTSDPA